MIIVRSVLLTSSPPAITSPLPPADTPAAVASPPSVAHLTAPSFGAQVLMDQPQAAAKLTAMPLSTSPRAPYFSGRVDDSIKDFLHVYEELATSCQLTEQQKVESIIRYTASSQRKLWKTLPGYAAHDWAEFRRSLERIYTRTSSKERYTKTNLDDFVNQSSKSHMLNEGTHGLAPDFLTPKPAPFAPSSATVAHQAPSVPQTTSQPSPRKAELTPAPPQPSCDNPTALFRSRPRSDSCAFCNQSGHRVRQCKTAEEYVRGGCATIRNDRIHLPNGDPIPNDGTGRGLQASIDAWLATHTPVSSVPTHTSVRDGSPHGALGFETRGSAVGCLESTTEFDFIQVVETDSVKKEKVPTPHNGRPRPPPKYRLKSAAEDQRLIDELLVWLLEGKLAQITPAHVLAASPSIRKKLIELVRVRRVETGCS